MRADNRIIQQIEEERQFEASKSGCCIADDETCFQTSDCNTQFAVFSKWTDVDGRKQPVVCGQDPRLVFSRLIQPYSISTFRFCELPKRFDWSDDTSNWPTCSKTSELIPKRERHMTCELTGRPCCIQMHGQCRITTEEYCNFVKGYYHKDATLCSQVSCMNEVCGMSPFLRKDHPDQFYRFFLPLFIHAG
jgi:hypothetical protein